MEIIISLGIGHTRIHAHLGRLDARHVTYELRAAICHEHGGSSAIATAKRSRTFDYERSNESRQVPSMCMGFGSAETTCLIDRSVLTYTMTACTEKVQCCLLAFRCLCLKHLLVTKSQEAV